MDFTEEQKQIFHFVQNETGHGIIDAVAGAGKTTTIMECSRYVQNQSEILFCAFNNSIATEILQKFRHRGFNEVTVKTIHALGWQILGENNRSGYALQLDDNKFEKILNTDDIQEQAKQYVDKILEINGYDPLVIPDERQLFAINGLKFRMKNRLLEINQKFRATLTKDELPDFKEMVIHFGIFNETEIAKKHFDEELAQYFAIHTLLLERGTRFSQTTMIIDYTDMLYLPCKWNLRPIKKYDFLFIDECQDLSKSQFAIASKYGRKTSRILAVGDPRQSIYGFTGADIESFDRVKHYTKAKQFPLTVCFRCPQRVIALAREIREDISGNKQDHGNVTIIDFDSVVDTSVPGDLIISRLRVPLLLLVFNFIDRNIKVQIHPDEVKEIIKDLKSIFKMEEQIVSIPSLFGEFAALKNSVLGRQKWIINKNAERIIDQTARQAYIERETQELEKKLEFLHKKYELWKDECYNITKILERIKEYITATQNSVRLSTIHRAKGLENDRVFILHYDELPYKLPDHKPWQKTQETNLKYVAITRAKKELFLVQTKETDEIEEEQSLYDNLPFDF